MDLSAKITGLKYKPYLCAVLPEFDIAHLEQALSKSAFILDLGNGGKVAASRWVSPKRTRSYPYARVYDTLGFGGKKITIIPVMKDEGKRGDRDFLQWDTVAMMSLLGVYVIIAYYATADRSARYRHKITNQQFHLPYISQKLTALQSYHSDPLHWNLEQLEDIGNIGQTALDCYRQMADNLDVEFHSEKSAERKIETVRESKDAFISHSRDLAEAAQRRETVTTQPKENVAGAKASITITNYLGGNYYLTLDEVEISGSRIHLIEAKHSRRNMLPSPSDIKDALIKMALFTNLSDVESDGVVYDPVPVMKLTGNARFDPNKLNRSQKKFWLLLMEHEAKFNEFDVRVLT